jgi:hypothetical protein
MVPNVKSREGWELYIVTDGVMVGILLGEEAHWAPSPSNNTYVSGLHCHPQGAILVPSERCSIEE